MCLTLSTLNVLYELCPAPSLEGNTPYGLVAHGVPQANPENDEPLWQFDLTCGKTQWENHTQRGFEPTPSLDSALMHYQLSWQKLQWTPGNATSQGTDSIWAKLFALSGGSH
jgi:hypothetical protein